MQQRGFVRYLTEVRWQSLGEAVDLELGAPDVGRYFHQFHVLQNGDNQVTDI